MGYDMTQIKEIFEEAATNSSLVQKEEIRTFIVDLESFSFVDGSQVLEAEAGVIYYVAGYIAKSITAKSTCDQCNSLVSPGKQELLLKFDEILSDTEGEEMKAREEFTASISRGGLHRRRNFCVF